MESQLLTSNNPYDLVAEPHIASFNEIISHDLNCLVTSLPSLEFYGPNCERLSLVIEQAQIGYNIHGQCESNVDLDFGECTIYPSECRIRRVSYTSPLKIHWYLSHEGQIMPQAFKFFAEVPIMVKSNVCKLYNMLPSELIFNGEDENEFGGYFIVNGMEKMIRLLLVQRRNYPLALIRQIWREKGDIFTDTGVSIRCVSKNHSVCIMTLHYLNNGSSILAIKLPDGRILYIPFIYILKAVVDITDYEILQEIMALNPSDNFLEGCVIAMLRGSLIQGFFTKSDILQYIGSRYKVNSDFPPWYTDIDIGKLFISECICIHLEYPRDKFLCLIEMCNKLYALVQNKIPPENPDSPVFQEVLLPGSIYLSVLRSALIAWMKGFRNDIVKQFSIHRSLPFSEIFDKTKRSQSFNLISSRMSYFMATGNVSRDVFGLPQYKGLTIIAEKLNFHRYISHFRSIHRGHFFTELRTTSVRKLLPDAWGFFCPVNTPDGSPCGLLNHLTASCSITTKYQCLDDLIHLLFEIGLSDNRDIIKHSSFRNLQDKIIKVSLDGKIVGYCSYDIATIVYNKLRELKVMGDMRIPSNLEIILPMIQQPYAFPGFYLFSTPGRLMRPLQNIAQNSIEMIGTFEQAYLQIAISMKYDNGLDATHWEVNDTSMLSIIASLTPFSDFNQSPRNMYQCQMSKQTMGTPCHSFESRSDNKLYRLISPQNPLVVSTAYPHFLMGEYPQGINSIVAVISHTGYDMEDAIIINKYSCQRGFAHACLYRTMLIDLISKQNLSNNNNIFQFGFVNYPSSEISKHLDTEGLPRVGSYLNKGIPFYAYYDKLSHEQYIEYYRQEEVSWVDKIHLIGPKANYMSGFQVASIKLRIVRNLNIGDKFSSRHGQKGICSILWSPENLPFTEKGIIPDILFNPHGFPSRMTIGMLIECMAAKKNGITGKFDNATAFQSSQTDLTVDYFGKELLRSGFQFYGSERMYSGFTGTEFDTDIFIGPIYYQRLRHMISDKFQVRTTGPINPITHQPVHGKRRSGGLRFGEMERDCLISHGTSYLLQDRLSNCSDKAFCHICTNCGNIISPSYSTTNAFNGNYSEILLGSTSLDTSKDRTLTQQSWRCSICASLGIIELLALPYVFILLISELVSMNIKVFVKTT